MARCGLGLGLVLVLGLALSGALAVRSDGHASAQTQGQPREVRVAVRHLEPFVIKGGDGRFSGFSIDLWEDIARRNDFRTTYVEVNSVTEQLDAVRSGRADIGITAISITAERERTVDFSQPMFNSGLQIAVPAARVSETGGVWQTLTSPVVRFIIAIMLGSIVVAAFIVWLIERHDNPDFAKTGVRGFGEGVWWAVVTLLTVGYGDRVTKSAAGRAFSMVFMLFGVLLVATFTATFTASLTVRNLQTEVQSPSDLKGHQVITVRGTTSATYLRSRGIEAEEVDNIDDMLGRLSRNEVEAAVYDAPVLTYAARQGNSAKIRLVGAPFTREYYGIAEQQNTDLGEPIDFSLLQIYDDGTYTRLYNSWFGES